MTRHRIFSASVASVYPFYVAKAEKKGRTKAEVDEIIRWLTGHSEASFEDQLASKTSFEDFFDQAPQMNPLRSLITGTVCGVHVEEVRSRQCGKSAISTNSSTNWPRAGRWRRYCGDRCARRVQVTRARAPLLSAR